MNVFQDAKIEGNKFTYRLLGLQEITEEFVPIKEACMLCPDKPDDVAACREMQRAIGESYGGPLPKEIICPIQMKSSREFKGIPGLK